MALAGGIEEARRLLSDLRFRGMSLEVESYLNEAWPIRAGKTMSFVSPTNEQVAMQFVLDCGGYEQATARLEDLGCEAHRQPITLPLGSPYDRRSAAARAGL